MTITRDDVARRAGVSPATVSYVINNGPRPVADLTRRQVLQAIKDLGYVPSAVARSLRLQKTSTLGLIVPDTHNPYFSEVARGVERVAFENGYTVILCHSSYDVKLEMRYADMLLVQRAAGVIWIPATDDTAPFNHLSEHGIPTIVIDRVMKGDNIPAVVADNFRGGYLATHHLIQLGHQRIGCISRSTDLSHSHGRLEGYRAALEEHHLPINPALVAKGGFRLENGYEAAFELFNLPDPPTAIFAYNDIMAIGALRAAWEHGLSVPDELSLVGFDDIAQAAFTCPALTTISMPKVEIGQHGAQLLISAIKDEKPLENTTTVLGVELVVRESTVALLE